ncbi:hypothetical protein AHF37_12402 [Paragonimus kellicotti]|nr:hypothetical protein AHF37_12402 [Paragonimus kellicotti]
MIEQKEKLAVGNNLYALRKHAKFGHTKNKSGIRNCGTEHALVKIRLINTIERKLYYWVYLSVVKELDNEVGEVRLHCFYN